MSQQINQTIQQNLSNYPRDNDLQTSRTFPPVKGRRASNCPESSLMNRQNRLIPPVNISHNYTSELICLSTDFNLMEAIQSFRYKHLFAVSRKGTGENLLHGISLDEIMVIQIEKCQLWWIAVWFEFLSLSLDVF